MSVYYYPTGPVYNIATLVSNLDYRITIDLELPVSDYTSTTYNSSTGYVEVTFANPLNTFNTNLLNNIVTIVLYNGVLGQDVYPDDFSDGSRRSFKISSTPTSNHDINSGYSVGSLCITTSNDVYICTDNTVGSAVWVQLN